MLRNQRNLNHKGRGKAYLLSPETRIKDLSPAGETSKEKKEKDLNCEEKGRKGGGL